MRPWRKLLPRILIAAVGVLALGYIGYLEWSQPASEPGDAGQAQSPAEIPRGPPSASSTKKAPPETIRIGWTAWTDAEIVTILAARLLEERFGYEVERVMADIGIQYQGVASGDLDVMMMAWLPLAHQNYWRRVGQAVVNLGPIYTRGRLGWAVPAYIPRERLDSIEDLAKPAIRRRLDAKIQGIDPGAGIMQASETVLERYGLEGYELVSSSEAAMTAGLSRSLDRQEWFVFTAWSPHWMFARWDLRYLEDPRGILGGRERVHVLVREGFYQDYPPEVSEFFVRMFLPLEDLEAAMLTATQENAEIAAEQYMQDHPDQIEYWVTGQLEAR